MGGVVRLLLVGIFAWTVGCREPSDGKVHVTYWEKWGGFEAAAMQRVVDEFNRTVGAEQGIVVEYLSTANVDRKTLVATAGGDPPDVAGLWLANLYSFADRSALMPLDDFIRAAGFTPAEWQARYAPVYGDMGEYRGKIWGVVSTPSMTALHWNKTLFREAGLDPERPPRTVAELDEMAERLTKRDPRTGQIQQIGFLPQEPGWFAWSFPQWFGGQLFDGAQIMIGRRAENRACYQWVESYTRRYGRDAVRAFASGFGNFASPQNPFMAGKVAMVFQGVWMHNYLQQFAPGMDLGIAPWPATRPGLENFSPADADVLAIPRGARHPRAAWEFLRYVSTANPGAQSVAELTGMELLCYGQKKNSPLREWSPAFANFHPHPQIALFRQLAESPNAVHTPKIGIWQEYNRELALVFETARLREGDLEAALAFCQRRIEQSWALHRRSVERRSPPP
jgi:ABC-type glycerol-3-phosphate transport system substrate-binding protein